MLIYCELLSSLTCRWSSSTNVNVLLEFPASLRHLRVIFYCKCSADSEKCSVIIILESPFSAALARGIYYQEGWTIQGFEPPIMILSILKPVTDQVP